VQSPGRLLFLILVFAGVYALFFSAPRGDRAEGRFDADRLAAREVEVLQASQGREEFGVYIAVVPMLREQYRYSWFRAAQAGFYMARALTQFVDMRQRYERILPDLVEAATIERNWMNASFDPAAAARAQLDWWVTRRLPNLNSASQIAPLIAHEYSLRFRISESAAADAGLRRAQALDLAQQIDPKWSEVRALLRESNEALAQALTRSQHADR
jgi:hypothetical protein